MSRKKEKRRMETQTKNPNPAPQGAPAQGAATETKAAESGAVQAKPAPSFADRRNLPYPRRYRGFFFNGG